MKTVLCFGDSNTWGYKPVVGGRYSEQQRWTALLNQLLPEDWQVIEEGQPGRTTGFHESIHSPHSGLGYFLPCLEKHKPDLVVIMLGTNDLQSQFGLTAQDISQGAAQLVKQAQHFAKHTGRDPRHVLFVCPPPIREIGFAQTGFEGAAKTSAQLHSHYQARAEELNVAYFNAAEVVHSSPNEGVHWEQDQHTAFAQAITVRILTMIG